MVEVDKDILANPLHMPLEILETIEVTFLGADEPAAKRSELEDLRQQGGNKSENQIPAYCRHFLQKAEEAYGVVNRAAEVESKLAELFTTSLYSEEVAREIFEHDPPLIILVDVQNRATEIYNRSRRMSRAWKGRRRNVPVRRETPMEIGPVESNGKALLDRISQLEAELARLKSGKPQSDNPSKPVNTHAQQNQRYTGPRTTGAMSSCYECGKNGHFGRDCSVRKARLAQEAAAAHTSHA